MKARAIHLLDFLVTHFIAAGSVMYSSNLHSTHVENIIATISIFCSIVEICESNINLMDYISVLFATGSV